MNTDGGSGVTTTTVASTSTTTLFATTSVRIVSASRPELCVTDGYGSAEQVTAGEYHTVTEACNREAANQRFSLISTAEGYLIKNLNTNTCLGADPAASAPIGAIVSSLCSESKRQYWKIILSENHAGQYYFKPVINGHCMMTPTNSYPNFFYRQSCYNFQYETPENDYALQRFKIVAD